MVPRPENVAGLVTLQDWLWIPEKSVAEGIVKAAVVAVETPLVGEIVKLAGQVSRGGSLSETVTGNEQLAVLLAQSFAVQETTVVVKMLNEEPESGQSSDRIPDPSDALTTDAKLTMGLGRLSDAEVV